jgi:hypothetical protein
VCISSTRICGDKCLRMSCGGDLEALGFSVQGVLQLQSGHCDQGASKACPLTPNFVVLVAQGSEVLKVHSLTTVQPASLGG